MKKALFLCLTIFSILHARGQASAEETRSTTIHSIKIFKKGNQLSLPVIPLNSVEQLELHFDDFQSGSKNYFYTYQLCNADWTPANLSQMDFIKGFSQNRISQYRFSSIAFTRYVHYQINLPAANCMPSRSGNYLLKVFTNGDTSNLVFSRRIMIVDDRASIGAEIQQPFTQELFRTHQKLVTRVNFKSLDVFNPQQQVKLVVLQNYRWDNAQEASTPTFIRGKEFEYSSEDNFIFEGGKEWRWLDLRSYRLQSDRVRSIDYKANSYDVYPVYDTVRSGMRYVFFRDLNGRYIIETLESINPWWQGDYARVHFKFLPQNPEEMKHRNFYLVGELTNQEQEAQTPLAWNDELKVFEKTLLLKNGFYSYAFATKEPGLQQKPTMSFTHTEGNVWDTENQYSILVYYRPFGGRSDELLGFAEISSLRFLNNR